MFNPIKWRSSLIINFSLLLFLAGIFFRVSCENLLMLPISLCLGLCLGETVVFAHGWKQIDGQIPHHRSDLLWVSCITGHVIYAFLSCAVFLIVNCILFNAFMNGKGLIATLDSYFWFEVILILGIGLVTPSFQFFS